MPLPIAAKVAALGAVIAKGAAVVGKGLVKGVAILGGGIKSGVLAFGKLFTKDGAGVVPVAAGGIAKGGAKMAAAPVRRRGLKMGPLIWLAHKRMREKIRQRQKEREDAAKGAAAVNINIEVKKIEVNNPNLTPEQIRAIHAARGGRAA